MGRAEPGRQHRHLYSNTTRASSFRVVHAAAIKTRGEWIRGCIDPAAKGSSQYDGKQLKATYQSLGLSLIDANNELETGLIAVWQALALGQLKIFSTLQSFKAEYRVYQRDERGRIKDGQADHLMDCTRYLWRTWDKVASLPPLRVQQGGSGIANADSRAGY